MDYKYDHILIRYGELSLKGKNRNTFIKQLHENIKKLRCQHNKNIK